MHEIHILIVQGFRQFFFKFRICLKAPDSKFFWRHKAPYERRRYELSRRMWGHASPGNFIIEHSRTLFPAFLEPKNQSFPGKAGVLSNSEKK